MDEKSIKELDEIKEEIKSDRSNTIRKIIHLVHKNKELLERI